MDKIALNEPTQQSLYPVMGYPTPNGSFILEHKDNRLVLKPAEVEALAGALSGVSLRSMQELGELVLVTGTLFIQAKGGLLEVVQSDTGIVAFPGWERLVVAHRLNSMQVLFSI